MTLPMFGRKCKITVELSSGDSIVLANSANEDEPLQIHFEVEQLGYQAFWFGLIEIYNLTAMTEQYLIKEGDRVTVEAGYENGPYGEIFSGFVFQPMWERRNVVDFVTTLHCLVGREDITNNFVSFTRESFARQYDLVAEIARKAHSPVALESVATDISSKMLPRGKVVFGSPGKYFEQIAADNKMQWWVSDKGLNIGSTLKGPGSDEALLVSPPPNGTLVGTPQQTQDGVVFSVLLDARIRVQANPPMQVKLDMAAIRQYKKQIGDISALTILDQDGLYMVGGIRHVGDTRANLWLTEVTGYTSVGGKLAAMMESANDVPPKG